MMEQTIMPFKLESTEECLTPHGGLALFGEFCAVMKVSDQVNRHLPAPGSARGFMPSVYVQSLVLMLHGGGRSLEDLRILSLDDGLKPLLGMRVPSPDAMGNWLRRMGSYSGLDALKVVQNKQLKWALKRESEKNYGDSLLNAPNTLACSDGPPTSSCHSRLSASCHPARQSSRTDIL